MIDVLSRAWWLVAVRGILAIAFGILAFALPGITLLLLVLLFGAYMLVDGIIALAQAARFRHDRERWPALAVEGILGIIVGLISLWLPGITAVAWLYTIAFWAFVTGVLEIVSAIRLRRAIRDEWFLIFAGLVSIALAVALFVMPLAGLLAWVYLLGAYAIVFGVLLIGLAFRLRGMGVPTSPPGVTTSGTT